MTDAPLTNRALAERVGWRVIENPEGRSATGTIPMDLWHNGVLVHTERASHAERYVIEMRAWEHIPDYLHSVDVALTLPLGEEHFWDLWGDEDWWECTVTSPQESDDRLTAKAVTAAEAVCRAWLNFKEQENK
jgi:hypothetical protein